MALPRARARARARERRGASRRPACLHGAKLTWAATAADGKVARSNRLSATRKTLADLINISLAAAAAAAWLLPSAKLASECRLAKRAHLRNGRGIPQTISGAAVCAPHNSAIVNVAWRCARGASARRRRQFGGDCQSFRRATGAPGQSHAVRALNYQRGQGNRAQFQIPAPRRHENLAPAKRGGGGGA